MFSKILNNKKIAAFYINTYLVFCNRYELWFMIPKQHANFLKNLSDCYCEANKNKSENVIISTLTPKNQKCLYFNFEYPNISKNKTVRLDIKTFIDQFFLYMIREMVPLINTRDNNIVFRLEYDNKIEIHYLLYPEL